MGGRPARSFSVRLMNITNQEVQVLTPGPSEPTDVIRMAPPLAWSPDSKKLAYERYLSGPGSEVYSYELTSAVSKKLDSSSSGGHVLRFVGNDRLVVAHSKEIAMFRYSTGLKKEVLLSGDGDSIFNIRVKGNRITYKLNKVTQPVQSIGIPD